MQSVPLTVASLFERAERYHGAASIVTAGVAGRERTTVARWADRTRRLASAIVALGVGEHARVGTFGWNTARHLELYFAVPGIGRVLHTVNIRLFPEQITYIVNHAADEVLVADRSLLGILGPLLPTFTTVRHLVVMNDGAGEGCEVPDGIAVHDYEDLVAAASPASLHVGDERLAASMCYTSGTTGNPKGVVYSHRSMWLHTIGAMTTDSLGICGQDTVLPVVPMFHVNAWGLAHAAVACGANLVLPGSDLSGKAIADLMVDERVTVAAGVPTIWMNVLPELAGRDTSRLRAIPCGGAAVPKTLSESYRTSVGVPILQIWGMTETSPIAAVCTPIASDAALDEAERAEIRTTAGRAVLGVDVRIVVPGTTDPVAWDGETTGELQCRGNWIAATYYDDARSTESFTEDGWLRTGDIASIDPLGRVRLVDRMKDLIKSGGEWISSVEVENELMAHPKVKEAAVVGVPHPTWSERPIACVVVHDGQLMTREEVLDHLRPRLAKWQVPDDVVFLDQIPRTSVGKFSKKTLRDRFADHTLPT